MSITFNIKLTVKDLYKFNLRQVYRGLQGFLSILLPVLLFAYGIMGIGKMQPVYTLLYMGLALVFLFYVPVSLWLRVKKLLANPENVLAGSLSYTFSEEGIQVSVPEESVSVEWAQIYRIVQTNSLLLIYTNRMHAYVIPLEQIGDHFDELSRLAHKKLDKYRIKMK